MYCASHLIWFANNFHIEIHTTVYKTGNPDLFAEGDVEVLDADVLAVVVAGGLGARVLLVDHLARGTLLRLVSVGQ